MLRTRVDRPQGSQISAITWIELLVGCRAGESDRVEAWLHWRRAASPPALRAWA